MIHSNGRPFCYPEKHSTCLSSKHFSHFPDKKTFNSATVIPDNFARSTDITRLFCRHYLSYLLTFMSHQSDKNITMLQRHFENMHSYTQYLAVLDTCLFFNTTGSAESGNGLPLQTM